MLHGFKLVHDLNTLEDNLENEVKKKAQTKENNTCLFVLSNSMSMIPSLRFSLLSNDAGQGSCLKLHRPLKQSSSTFTD